MKKLALLMIPAALALAGCNFNNNGISKEEAQKIAQSIDEEAENIKNIEFSFTAEAAEGKGEDRKETNTSMILKQNEDTTYYLRSSSPNGDYTEMMHVFDEEYEEVIFMVAKSGEATRKSALVKKDNAMFGFGAAMMELATIMIKSMYATYATPYETLLSKDDASADDEFNSTITFESSGEKNLVIKGHSELKDMSKVTDNEETRVSADFTVEYENLRLTKISTVSRSNYNNESKYDIGVSYSDTAYSFALPADWTNYIEDLSTVK